MPRLPASYAIRIATTSRLTFSPLAKQPVLGTWTPRPLKHGVYTANKSFNGFSGFNGLRQHHPHGNYLQVNFLSFG